MVNLRKGLASLEEYREQLTDFFPAVSQEDITEEQLKLRNVLGLTDYSTQSKAAQDMARLNFALSLAQRGFEMAGAAPRPGESGISTMSRAIAPLAGDVRTVASDYMKQKAAFDLAEQQEERQLKMLGYQSAQERLDKESATWAGLLPELIKSDKVTRTLEKNADFTTVFEVDGNPISVTGTGPLSITTNTVSGDVTAHTATQIRTTDNDGEERVLPVGTIVTSWMSAEKPGDLTLWKNPTNKDMTFELSGRTVTIPAGGTQHLTNEELYEARNEFPEVAGQLRKWAKPTQPLVDTTYEAKLYNNRSDKTLNFTRNGVDISVPPDGDIYLDKRQFSDVQSQLDQLGLKLADVLVAAKDPKREEGISYGQIVTVGEDGKTIFSDAQQIRTSNYYDQNGQLRTQAWTRENNRGEWLAVDPENVIFLPEDQKPWTKTNTLYAPEGVITGVPRGAPIEVWTSAAKTPAGTQQTRYRYKGKWIDLSKDTIKALSAQELKDWADSSILYVPKMAADTGAESSLIPGTNIKDEIIVKTRTNAAGELEISYWHGGKRLKLNDNQISQLRAQNPDTPATVTDTLYVHDVATAATVLGVDVVSNAEITSTTQTLNGVETTTYYYAGRKLDAAEVHELIDSGVIQTAKKAAVGESKQYVYTGPDITGGVPGTPAYSYNQKFRLTNEELAALPPSVRDNLADLDALNRDKQHHLITRKIENQTGEIIWFPGQEWYGDQQQADVFRQKHGQDVITTWEKGKALLIKENSFQNIYTSLVNEMYPHLDAAHKDFKLTDGEKAGLLGKFPTEGRAASYVGLIRTELLDLLSRKIEGHKPVAGMSQKDKDASIAAAEQIESDAAARAILTERTDAADLTYSEKSAATRADAKTRPLTGWDALYDRKLVGVPWNQLPFERQQAFSLIPPGHPKLKDLRLIPDFIDAEFNKMAERKATYTHPTGPDIAEFQNLIRVYAILQQIRDGGYLRDTGIIQGIFAKIAGDPLADWPLDIVFDEDTERLTVLMSQLRSSIEFINQTEGRPSDFRTRIKLNILPRFVKARSINKKNVGLAMNNLENTIKSYFDPSAAARRVVPPGFEQAANEVGIEVRPTVHANYPWINYENASPIFLKSNFLESIGVRRAGWAQFDATYDGDPVAGLNVPEETQTSIKEKYPNSPGAYYIKLNEEMVKGFANHRVNEGLPINPKGAYVILVIRNAGPNHQDLIIPQLYDMSAQLGKRGGE